MRLDYEGKGICKSGKLPVLARASVHLWEEPCISGARGSGTVFFSGCALKCVYCQNNQISTGGFGKTVSQNRLREIFNELINQGVHNINLVNPTHFSESILETLGDGLSVPVVYNTSGYDNVSTLRQFEGKVQIYLPDLKYALREPAEKYSAAPDYPEIAISSILEMYRQTGPYELGEDGLLKSGVIIRHLILPGNLENTFRVIDWVSETFSPGEILFSLMSQFTPCGVLDNVPELSRRISASEYESAVRYLEKSNIADGFYQELSSAEAEYIPEFDLRGV